MKVPMKTTWLAFFFLFWMALVPSMAQTQPAPNAGDQPVPDSPPSETVGQAANEDPYKFVVKTSEVNLIFTVTDKRGRFIKDLKQNNFKLLDDKKPPEAIRDFRSETDLPLRVGLIIDCSESIRDRFKFEQESAIEFLNQVIRHKTDQAFVLGLMTFSKSRRISLAAPRSSQSVSVVCVRVAVRLFTTPSIWHRVTSC
jgi:hypothetical protein